MSSYPDLIQRIFSHSKQSKAQALRKLIYLAVNDQNKFTQYVPQIAQQLPKTLTDIEDEQVKLLSLQLLSQMATNYTTRIPVQCYTFPQLVALLSDQNVHNILNIYIQPQVRKASHYLILIFIKKYQQIDQVIQGYLSRIQSSPQHWKILQKVIHSFQSLLVIQPKCVTYSHNYSHMDQLMKLLLGNRNHQHSLVQKASQQTVNSFVKNQYVPEILPKLDRKVMAELVQYAEKISINLQPKRKSPFKQGKEFNREREDDIQEIQITTNTQIYNTQVNINKEKDTKYSPKISTTPKNTITQSSKPVPANNSILQQLIIKLDSQSDWKIKSQTIQQIHRELTLNTNSEIPQILIQKVLDLTYDYNFKTCITSMNVLLTLTNLYPHKISAYQKQIQDVIIDKICDLKMAVRQLGNKILRNLYINKSRDFVKRILSKLGGCSVVGKEEILGFLQQVLTSNNGNDLPMILGQISNQLLNQNTRVKIKAVDCLVKISMANDVEQCKMILNKKLSKVYYQMFMERLRDKMGMDKPQTWDQKTKLKKGMTWQAPERGSQFNIQANDRQSSTKIQFGVKKNFNQTQQDFAQSNFGNQNKEKNLATTSNSYKTSNTLNTFKSMQQPSSLNTRDKKTTQSSQATSFIAFETDPNTAKEADKKIPMKPTPIKKKTTLDSNSNKEQNPLVIHSKQYQNKRSDQQPTYEQVFGYRNVDNNNNNKNDKNQERKESIDDKPKMRINKNRDRSVAKVKEEQPAEQLKQTKQIPSQPFSIKKSGSKKQHVIDYKATHYAAKDDLSPLDNPKETLKFVMTNLPKDNDWNKQFESLDYLRRLIKNHEDLYPVLSQNLPGIMPQVLKLVQSLRSSVAKNAMITLSQMCQALKKSMDPYLQPLFVKLFKKAQDANSFIVQQVKKCMTSLCTYCSTAKICAIIIINSNAKAIPIKTNVALCIDKILQKKQYDCQVLKQNIKVVSVMSNMITDGSAEVRNMVKEIFIQLLDFNNVAEIQGLFKRTSSKDAWERWKNIMDKEASRR